MPKVLTYVSLNNGYVEGSFITFLEPVRTYRDSKSVVRNLVALLVRVSPDPQSVVAQVCQWFAHVNRFGVN